MKPIKIILVACVLFLIVNAICSNLGDGSKYVTNRDSVMSCAPGFPSGWFNTKCWDGGWDYWAHVHFVSGLGYIYQ